MSYVTDHLWPPIASGEQLRPTGTLEGTTRPNDIERSLASVLSKELTELPKKWVIDQILVQFAKRNTNSIEEILNCKFCGFLMA